MDFAKEWQLRKAEKFWPVEEQKEERKYPYLASHVIKNDDKKTIFKGVILF